MTKNDFRGLQTDSPPMSTKPKEIPQEIQGLFTAVEDLGKVVNILTTKLDPLIIAVPRAEPSPAPEQPRSQLGERLQNIRLRIESLNELLHHYTSCLEL